MQRSTLHRTLCRQSCPEQAMLAQASSVCKQSWHMRRQSARASLVAFNLNGDSLSAIPDRTFEATCCTFSACHLPTKLECMTSRLKVAYVDENHQSKLRLTNPSSKV